MEEVCYSIDVIIRLEKKKESIKMGRQKVASLYNPSSLSREDLINGFVVRTKKFERIFHDIKSASMETPAQPIMIEAQRGMGKTTLLLRLVFEIENDPDLNPWLIPVRFNEEEFSIQGLFSFWELTADILEEREPEIFEGLYDKMTSLTEEDLSDFEYERKIFKILENRLKKNKKKIILFIENFNDILEKFDKKATARLRTILTESAEIRLIVAAPIALEDYFKYDKSFYGFFKQYQLKGLNSRETKELLFNLGKINNEQDRVAKIIQENEGRVESVRRLTGGIIRTIVFLFEVFLDDADSDSFNDINKIIDIVTPFYVERMKDLSKSQKPIVDAIAKNWDAITVKELVKATRLESKVISAQLNQLVKTGIVSKQPTNTKNNLYLLKERFFNIWYLMRYSRRGDKRRVMWLTKFYETWCNSAEIEYRARRIMDKIDEANPEYLFYKVEAISSASILNKDVQHELLQKARTRLEHTDKMLHSRLSLSEIDILTRAKNAKTKKEYEKSLELLENARDKDGENRYRAGVCYKRLEDYLKAEECYLEAYEKEYKESAVELGLLYGLNMKNYDSSKQWFNKAIEDKDFEARSYNGLGLLHQNELKDYNKSEEYFIEAVELGYERSIRNLGKLYHLSLKDYKKAEKWYLKGAEYKYDKDNEGRDHSCYNALGEMYRHGLNNYEKAKEYYLKAYEMGNEYSIRGIGLLYHYSLKYYEKAKEWYLKGTEYEYAEENKHQRHKCYNDLGILFEEEFKDYKKSEEYYLKAYELGNEHSIRNLGLLYYYSLEAYRKAEEWYLKGAEYKYNKKNKYLSYMCYNGLGVLYKTKSKDFEKSEEYYLKAYEMGSGYSIRNLGNLYYSLGNYEKAEKWYMKGTEYKYSKEEKEQSHMCFHDLGVLYQIKLNDYKKSEEFYLKAYELGNEYSIMNLGVLYENSLGDYEKAEKWYLRGVKYGFSQESKQRKFKYCNSLAWMYYKNKIKKDKALEYSEEAFKGIQEPYLAHTLASIQLWHNQFENSIKSSMSFLYDKEYLDSEYYNKWAQNYLLLLLAKKQYPYLLEYFTGEEGKKVNSKDRFKPIYYALMYYLQDEYPLEYLRMGPELKETVDEVRAKAEQMAIDYA